ncbi:3-hydroxyacyl-CoA dehydrogenase family protein [Bacteroidota bacterium]
MTEVVEPIESYALKTRVEEKKYDTFSKVGIVGCGILGQEIAKMAASHGMDVVFLEISEEKIQAAYDGMKQDLDRMIERWGMTASDKRAIMSRIKGKLDYKYLKGCDVVIESIKSRTREDSVDLRKLIFKNLEKVVSRDTIICTNSTTLVITELSSELTYPDRCVSLHFISPAGETPIVEVARSLHTSDEAYEKVCKFASFLDKRIVPVIESPGIISTRLIAPLINEACEILMEGVASMEDIDATMKLGFGFPLGPFEMADKIGLDMVIRWLDNLYNEFGEIKYKASPMLKKRKRAGHLGQEAGRGFYQYDENGKKIIIKN